MAYLKVTVYSALWTLRFGTIATTALCRMVFLTTVSSAEETMFLCQVERQLQPTLVSLCSYQTVTWRILILLFVQIVLTDITGMM